MAKTLLTSLILLSFFFPISSPVFPTETVFDAVEILSDSGYLAMSLTLELVAQTLISHSSSVTLFAPPDDAFKDSGQPSLDLLQYHFSPLKFSIESLKTLPFGTKIPTLYGNHSLVVTTSASDQNVSLNNVRIDESPIYDVGAMAVYGISKFFDPDFEASSSSDSSDSSPAQSVDADSGCADPARGQLAGSGLNADKLKFSHYSVFGEFLDWQLLGIHDNRTKLTVFAPNDAEIIAHLKNFSSYSSIFRRHVLPCKVTWTDLVNLGGPTSYPSFLKGYSVNITRSGDVMAANGVPVVFPEVFSGERVVVHGIRKMLEPQAERVVLSGDSISELQEGDVKSTSDYGGEF